MEGRKAQTNNLVQPLYFLPNLSNYFRLALTSELCHFQPRSLTKSSGNECLLSILDAHHQIQVHRQEICRRLWGEHRAQGGLYSLRLWDVGAKMCRDHGQSFFRNCTQLLHVPDMMKFVSKNLIPVRMFFAQGIWTAATIRLLACHFRRRRRLTFWWRWSWRGRRGQRTPCGRTCFCINRGHILTASLFKSVCWCCVKPRRGSSITFVVVVCHLKLDLFRSPWVTFFRVIRLQDSE